VSVNVDSEDFIWQNLALCTNIVGKRKPNGDADDPLFDSYESEESTAKATDEMCSRCPVKKNCFLEGVENGESGVWGGWYLTNGAIDLNRNAHKPKEEIERVKAILA
jgi:hypothetical protein